MTPTVAELSQKITDLEGKLTASNDATKAAELKVTELEGKLTAAQDATKAAEQKVTDLEGKLTAANDATKAAEQKVTDLEGKLSAETAKVTDLTGKLTVANDATKAANLETARVTEIAARQGITITKATASAGEQKPEKNLTGLQRAMAAHKADTTDKPGYRA